MTRVRILLCAAPVDATPTRRDKDDPTVAAGPARGRYCQAARRELLLGRMRLMTCLNSKNQLVRKRTLAGNDRDLA